MDTVQRALSRSLRSFYILQFIPRPLRYLFLSPGVDSSIRFHNFSALSFHGEAASLRQILDRSKLSGKTEQRNTSENDEHRIPRIIPSGIREKKNERLAKSLDRNIVASYVSSTASREQMVLVARVVPFRLNKNTLAATIFAARLDKHGEFLPDE